MKVTKISATMIDYREVSISIRRNCRRARQIKETLPGEILSIVENLQVRLLTLALKTGVQRKKIRIWFWFVKAPMTEYF